MRPKHLHKTAIAAIVALLVAHVLIAVPILRGWPAPAIAGALVLAALIKYLVWRARSRRWPFGR